MRLGYDGAAREGDESTVGSVFAKSLRLARHSLDMLE